MNQLERASRDKEDYNALWMKTKRYSQLISKLYEMQSAPKLVPVPTTAAPAPTAATATAVAPAPTPASKAPEARPKTTPPAEKK